MPRKIPLSKGNHITGFHPIRPGHGMVAFESKLECDFLSWITKFGGNPTVTSQPLTAKYLDHNNIWRKYTPDFLIAYPTLIPIQLQKWNFSTNTIIEIKYLAEAEKKSATIQRKLNAVRKMGYRTVLLTEVDITGDGMNEV